MSRQGFGARIRQAILDRGSQTGLRYTNRQLALDIGVSGSAITEWIAERSEPSIATFRAIAKATGKAPEWLMALDVEPTIKVGERLPRTEKKKPAAKPVSRRKRASGDG